jgi:hypothetical protein
MITTTTVTSRDGVKFSISFESANETTAKRAAECERNFAATRYAHQLDSFGDYLRVGLNGYVEAPAPKLPRIHGPLERRAVFAVLKGGKQS